MVEIDLSSLLSNIFLSPLYLLSIPSLSPLELVFSNVTFRNNEFDINC